jgi:hypothetical protein
MARGDLFDVRTHAFEIADQLGAREIDLGKSVIAITTEAWKLDWYDTVEIAQAVDLSGCRLFRDYDDGDEAFSSAMKL